MPNHTHFAKSYPSHLLDNELNLKPTRIWLATLALLTLPTWYGVGAAIARFTQGEWLPWLGYHDMHDWGISFAEQLPALIVLAALFRRSADASHLIRLLWLWSRWLLLLTAAGQIVHNIVFIVFTHHQLTTLILSKVVMYCWIIWYYLKSRFARDFPLSFPIPNQMD